MLTPRTYRCLLQGPASAAVEISSTCPQACVDVERLKVENGKDNSFPLDDLYRAIASQEESFPTIAWDVDNVSYQHSPESSEPDSSFESSGSSDDDDSFVSHTSKTRVRSRSMVRCVSIVNDLALMLPARHEGRECTHNETTAPITKIRKFDDIKAHIGRVPLSVAERRPMMARAS